MSQIPPQPTPLSAIAGFNLSPDLLLPLLEVSKGQSLTKEENPHFYTLSALLPLAQLTPNSRAYMVYAGFEETELLKLLGLDGGEMNIKLIEFESAIIGQSSRAIEGQERKSLSTTRIETTNTTQPEERVGLFSGLFSGGKKK